MNNVSFLKQIMTDMIIFYFKENLHANNWNSPSFIGDKKNNFYFLKKLSCRINDHQLLPDIYSDCGGSWTHNHLVGKRTLNDLAKLSKLLNCVVSTYLYGAFDCMFLSCHVRVDIQANTECGLTLKRVRGMIRTFSKIFIASLKSTYHLNDILQKKISKIIQWTT